MFLEGIQKIWNLFRWNSASLSLKFLKVPHLLDPCSESTRITFNLPSAKKTNPNPTFITVRLSNSPQASPIWINDKRWKSKSHPLDQFVNFESPTARGVLHKILEGGSTARKRQNVGETKVVFKKQKTWDVKMHTTPWASYDVKFASGSKQEIHHQISKSNHQISKSNEWWKGITQDLQQI